VRLPIIFALSALSLAATPDLMRAQAAPVPQPVTLTRLECSTPSAPGDIGRFDDTFAKNGQKVQLVASCYLIRHGDDFLVWDTGYPATGSPSSPKVSLVDQLAQLKVTPSQVKFVGISHYHGDHTGQTNSFPGATLLIGKGDWDVISDPKPNAGINKNTYAPWLTGGSKVEPQPADKDIFGDGSVIMLNLPGHTPGHHSLLVNLKEMGPVLLSGDVTHFRENYDSNGIPTFNVDRAQSIAALDRFKKIAAALRATVIIQHDARDVSKLPAFPASAK
jgi:N-acyl homoserine lactone hydrolase